LVILVVIAALSMAYLQYQKVQRSSPTQSTQPSLTHG